MAYTNTFYVYNVPAVCSESNNHDNWITADFKIVANANVFNKSYTVEMYAKINSRDIIDWVHDAVFRVKCNGVNAVSRIILDARTDEWSGPALFQFGTPGVSQLKLDIDLDLTVEKGVDGIRDITHYGNNITDFISNNYIIEVGKDGGLTPLIPPTQSIKISDLVNADAYSYDKSVSNSPNSISVKWSEEGNATKRYYSLDGGDWNEITPSDSKVKISYLTPGTTYVIYVKSATIDASGKIQDSKPLSITIRTRYENIEFNFTSYSAEVDSFTVNWESNMPLSKLECAFNRAGIKDEFRDIVADVKTNNMKGSIVINDINPNTEYEMVIWGISSTDEYDSINNVAGIYRLHLYSLDNARILSIEDCIFGNRLFTNIDKITNRNATLEIYTDEANTKLASIPITESKVINGVEYTPTLDQLDQIYKEYKSSNKLTLRFVLITHGKWKDFTETKTKDLVLTGIIRTGHIGINGNQERTQNWIGVNGKPRRCVLWIGDENNKPRRCI